MMMIIIIIIITQTLRKENNFLVGEEHGHVGALGGGIILFSSLYIKLQ